MAGHETKAIVYLLRASWQNVVSNYLLFENHVAVKTNSQKLTRVHTSIIRF